MRPWSGTAWFSSRENISRVKRPYFFEIFVVANLAIVVLFAHESLALLGSPVKIVGGLVLSMAVQALLGVIVRVVVALVRKDRGYLATIRSKGWLVDTTRLVVAAALVVFTYGYSRRACSSWTSSVREGGRSKNACL
jgi:hypothetical protein